ncbi:MAG: glutamine synthetase [Actinomycetia bacterium]|nr:glutamine synthetase [Actinomycetes bacterium]MCP3913681.1 glutamine synthetase [Actinomycetes bacterium]
MDRQHEYVLRSVEERGVRLIRLWFTDVTGQLKGIAISPAELETAFDEGMHFDGSSIDGFSRVQESDVLLRPDATTFELLPWETSIQARMFCDIQGLGGEPFEGDPRQVLKRTLGQAREQGFSFMVAPELEYFYFADESSPVPLDGGSYFDVTTSDVATDLRLKTISALEHMGIPIEYSFHEDSPSQHEIDLRYTDALTMADTVMTARLIVKELAQQAGVHATFMPKPISGVQGSGMHSHLSLFDGEANAFHEPGRPGQLSKVGQAFAAGLLRHAREITAITNQLVNSYKRLVVGYEAPVFVSWAHNNRSALLRVPVTRSDKSSSTRVEYRSPDPACNPYLAFSVMLAAGLRGIAEGYELPAEATRNLFEMTPAELAAADIEPLPQSLAEALEVMEDSDLVRDTVGEHIFEWFLRNKRTEWTAYKAHVSQFELDQYLGIW